MRKLGITIIECIIFMAGLSDQDGSSGVYPAMPAERKMTGSRYISSSHLRSGPTSSRFLPGPLRGLGLRGGVWYSGSDGEDTSEYSDEYTEHESEINPAEPREKGEDDPTDEEGAEAQLIPVGRWSAGRFPDDNDRFGLRDARARGPAPADSAPPHYIDEIYGLANYTFLAHELPNETYAPNATRSLLKVPRDELPPVFHFPCSGDAHGRALERRSLADCFAAWSGPAPGAWQARVVTPRGVISAHSVDKWVDLTLADVARDLGGAGCAA
jgi:hypothetical protein